MVSPSKPKYSRVANRELHKCRYNKGSKPLINFAFFLDVEKHTVASKIENKITELGGSIEFLLSKDTTHFITDKKFDREGQFVSPQSPISPGLLNLSKSTEALNTAGQQINISNGVYSSRTEAMLQLLDNSRYSLPNQQSLKSWTNKPIDSPQLNKTPVPQQSISSLTPIQQAKLWGVQIWSADYALRYLESLLCNRKGKATTAKSTLSAPSHHRSTVKTLKGNFIKIEAQNTQYRPYFSEFKEWPSINLNPRNTNNLCAFETFTTGQSVSVVNKNSAQKQSINNSSIKASALSKNKSNSMTRKTRGRSTRKQTDTNQSNDEKQCGYCELCRVEYDVLAQHIKSAQHLSFAKNDGNYSMLDKLVAKNEKTIENFLKLSASSSSGLNGKKPKRTSDEKTDNIRLNGGRKQSTSNHEQIEQSLGDLENESEKLAPSNIRRNVPRRKNSSIDSKPALNDIKLDESIAVAMALMEDGPNLRSRRDSQQRIPPFLDPKDVKIEESKSTKSQGTANRVLPKTLRWQPGSSSEGVPHVPTTPLYKVIDKSSPTKCDKNKNLGSSTNLLTGSSCKNVVVKIKRIRQSELCLLNDEASNFIFPKKDPTDCDTDEDRQSSSERGDPSMDICSSELEKNCSKNLNSPGVDYGIRRKRKPSQLEKTVTGSSKQVKLEQSDYCLRTKGCTEEKKIIIEPKPDSPIDFKLSNLYKTLHSEPIGILKFSFERVPESEPWFGAFQRQDECSQIFFEYPATTDYRKLPYEMGALPPLEPNCCFLSELLKDSKELNKVGRKRKKDGGTSQTDNEKTPTKIEEKSHHATRTSQIPLLEQPSTSTKFTPISPRSALSERKKKLLVELGHPRKSPRDHASTLAILSCLVQQRRKKEKAANGGISPEKSPSKSPIKPLPIPTPTKEPSPEKRRFRRNDSSSSCLSAKLEPETSDKVTDDDFVYPEIPKDEHIDMKQLCTEVDKMLTESLPDDSLESKFNLDSVISSDIIFHKDNDFHHLINITDDEPLFTRSRFFNRGFGNFSGVRNGKKRINRTGWPQAKRKLVPSSTITSSRKTSKESNEDVVEDERLLNPAVDVTSYLGHNGTEEFQIRSHQTPNNDNSQDSYNYICANYQENDRYKNDDDNSMNVTFSETLNFTSASEKTENSDIFTVSSDSIESINTGDKTEFIEEHLDDVDSVDSLETSVNVDSLHSNGTIDERELENGEEKEKNSKRDRDSSLNCPNLIRLLNSTIKTLPTIHLNGLNTVNDTTPVKKTFLNLSSGKNVAPKISSRSPSPPVLTKQLSPVLNNTGNNLEFSIKNYNRSPTISPRRLRNPRGRWYRER